MKNYKLVSRHIPLFDNKLPTSNMHEQHRNSSVAFNKGVTCSSYPFSSQCPLPLAFLPSICIDCSVTSVFQQPYKILLLQVKGEFKCFVEKYGNVAQT